MSAGGPLCDSTEDQVAAGRRHHYSVAEWSFHASGTPPVPAASRAGTARNLRLTRSRGKPNDDVRNFLLVNEIRIDHEIGLHVPWLTFNEEPTERFERIRATEKGAGTQLPT